MNNKDAILKFIKNQAKVGKKGVYAKEIAQNLNMQRSNVSSILNELYKKGVLFKIKGKPVLYTINEYEKSDESCDIKKKNFDILIGSDKSLKKCIQQAKAAILYPPHGLHTLILGPSGVGKTMFAELMHKFAIENGIFDLNAPFEVFNCADYANNSQLLLAHLFGCKKGTFTGADRDREGIVSKANGGILFLDEIHRLPPEGQEMLFYLIDKGTYIPLGSEDKKKSELLIICATTEDIDTSLLTTFTRRIPMNIKIPSLAERSLEERFKLICEFFKIESARIKRKILVSANTIRQLLLYDCLGNIGQLKSDIELGCANALLNSISKSLKNVEVHCTDFTSYVNQGLIIYKNNSKKVDKFVKDTRVFYFTVEGKENYVVKDDYSLPDNFYETIEKKVQELKKRGTEDSEIKVIIESDIENYFKHFMRNFERKIKKDELSKIVDEEIITLVENFLDKSAKKLKKIFPLKVFYGLCLHINSSISRLKSNKAIVNYNLENIKKNYENEFKVSREFVNILEEKYHIFIPEDEIGFIAMFLTVDEIGDQCLDNKPIIIIAMHGNATASSMTEVVNKLVGANNVYGYDMNLDKNSEKAYEELKQLIVSKHQGSGVMLLVDMGSFNIYGELINKDTGIKIRTLDMVSTPIAIECSRRAVTQSNIDKIYEEIQHEIANYIPYTLKVSDTFIPNRDNIIITLCTTGEGSAIKLKNFIETKVNTKEYKVDIFPMALNNKQHMYNIISSLSKNKNIVAIVGTINPGVWGIPYISTYEIFVDKDCKKLKQILNNNDKLSNNMDYSTFIDILQKEIRNVNLSQFKKLYEEFLNKIKQRIDIEIDYDISIGLMVHMVCNISKKISGDSIPECYSKDILIKKFEYEFNCIKQSLNDIEKYYEINFTDNEIAFILRNIIKM